MKKILFLALVAAFIASATRIAAQYITQKTDTLEWKLCTQAWTFHNFTFVESMDKIKEAGIQYIEMYPGQTIGGGISGTTNFSMDKETREKLLARIQTKGLKLINYGVVGPKIEEEWNKMFEFASAMGIKTIITEADSLQLNYIEPLCVKYGIFIALHNHPNPSHYWNPDYAMAQIANRNKYIGICADLGHWVRSGLDPVESLKKCSGKIFDVHAKDLISATGANKGYHDVPWGTGLSNFPGMMRELKNQHYNGTVTVEYEFNWDNSLPDVKASAIYFNQLTYWLNKE
jgi:sugar phosphate isomerase/epimerase